jgi:hypothetical protein
MTIIRRRLDAIPGQRRIWYPYYQKKLCGNVRQTNSQRLSQTVVEILNEYVILSELIIRFLKSKFGSHSKLFMTVARRRFPLVQLKDEMKVRRVR